MAQAKRRKGLKDQGSALEEMGGRKPDNKGEQSQTFQGEIRAGAGESAFSGRYQGSSGRSTEDENLKSISSQADNSADDLKTLQQEEFSGSKHEDIRSIGYSDTDEDEDEGLGDGNLGRTVRGGLEE
jgi:hypothetical protein